MNDINENKNKCKALKKKKINLENDLKTAKSDEYKMLIRKDINVLNVRLNRIEEYIITKEKELKKTSENGIYLFIYFFIYLFIHLFIYLFICLFVCVC